MVSGATTLKLEGTINFPSNGFQITGETVTLMANYTNIIADTFKFSGQGSFSVNSDYAASGIPIPYSMVTQDTLVQ